MIRQTSLAAFEEINYFGTINKNQKKIFEVIRAKPNITNTEIAGILRWSINRVTPRVLELRKKGLVRMFEKRPCTITGRISMSWGV